MSTKQNKTTDQFEIIDMHMHAWPKEGSAMSTPHEPTAMDLQVFEDTLTQMDQLGISQGVISGPDSVTVERCERAPHRFIASWIPDLNPSDPDEEAARFTEAIEKQGFRGLGELIMPYAGNPVNDKRFFPLYRICAERHLPVFCHTGLDGPNSPLTPSFRVNLGNPLLFEDVAAAFPDLRIVMCYMSYPFTEQATYMLYAYSNTRMKPTGPIGPRYIGGFYMYRPNHLHLSPVYAPASTTFAGLLSPVDVPLIY
jgi:predicted TIM-barrel fold metal-dependent hydrolase